MLQLIVLLASIAVTFVPLADGAPMQTMSAAAAVDLGNVSTRKVTTWIGVRASGDSGVGAVALQAYLDDPLPGITVSLDGIELGAMPKTFATNVPLGAVTRHRLEIALPASVDSSHLPSDIRLEVGAVQE